MAEVRLIGRLWIKQDIPGGSTPTDTQLLTTCKRRPTTGWLVLARVQTEKREAPYFWHFWHHVWSTVSHPSTLSAWKALTCWNKSGKGHWVDIKRQERSHGGASVPAQDVCTAWSKTLEAAAPVPTAGKEELLIAIVA